MITTKTKKVILLYLLFFSMAVLLEGCCKQKYQLTGIASFYAVNSSGSNSNPNEAIEIIRNDFTLVLSLEKQIAGLNFRLMNTAYALTCSPNLVNQILQDNIQLTCSKAFVYDGDTIQDGTNILALEHIVLSYREGYSRTSQELHITFTSDFIDKASFEESLYNFYVSVPTDDGLLFEKEKELLMLVN